MSIFSKNAYKLLLCWIILLSILYSTLSIVRHNHFESGGFDLGLYDQGVWQYSQFLYPYNTVKDRFILGDHLSLTLPLLSPLFWMKDDVRMLLVFQVVWVMISTLAIYKLARLRTLPELVSLCLAVVYTLFYGIQYLIFFDFHPISIGIGLLAWFCYFWEAKFIKRTIITCILILLTQENMGIALCGVSIIYFFRKEYRVSATIFFFAGVIWSVIASKSIAYLSPVGFQYTPVIPHDVVSIVRSYFDSEEKLQVLWYTFTSFTFLPILSPGTVIAILMDLGQYFATGPEFSRMWSPFMHHRGILAIFLVLGSIDVLVFFKKKRFPVETIAVILLLSCLLQQYVFHFPLNKLAKKSFWQEEQWIRDNNTMIAQIPSGASLATQQSLIPHLSHRKEIYLVWPRMHDFPTKPCGQISCWWLDFGGNPQYLLIDLHKNQWITQLLESNENVAQALTNMEKEGVITLKKKIGEISLYGISSTSLTGSKRMEDFR
jgi:uncharacterized membrane protein